MANGYPANSVGELIFVTAVASGRRRFFTKCRFINNITLFRNAQLPGDCTRNMSQECSGESQSPDFASVLFKCAGAIGGVALLATATFTGGSIHSDSQLRERLGHYGVRVHGTLTGFEGKSRNIADFRFTTMDGRVFDANYSGAMSYPELGHLSGGSEVDIVYDPGNPTQAIPEPFAQVPPCDLWEQLRLALKAIGVMVAAGLAVSVLTAIKITQQPTGDGFSRRYDQ